MIGPFFHETMGEFIAPSYSHHGTIMRGKKRGYQQQHQHGQQQISAHIFSMLYLYFMGKDCLDSKYNFLKCCCHILCNDDYLLLLKLLPFFLAISADVVAVVPIYSPNSQKPSYKIKPSGARNVPLPFGLSW